MQKLLLVFFSVSFFSSSAQFLKKWEANYEQPGYSAEESKKVMVDEHGDYYVLAKSGSDAIIIKYSGTSGQLWKYQTGFGTPIPHNSEPIDMTQDNAGNMLVLVAVPDCPFGPGCSEKNIMIFKLSMAGELLWSRFLDTGTPNALSNWKILTDSGGNIFCVLERNGDIITVKFDTSGEAGWERSFNRSGQVDVATGAYVASNDQILVFGYSATSATVSQKEPILIAYNSQGEEVINASAAFAEISLNNGAYPFLVEEHQNVLYVALKKNNAIYKFDLNTGASAGKISSNFYPGPDYFAVGNDGFLYMADLVTEDLRFRKYTLDGELLWAFSYNSSNGSTPYIDDFYFVDGLFERNDNKLYLLVNRKRFLNGEVTWQNQIYECSPDKTLRTVAALTNVQKNLNVNAFAFDGAGDFAVIGRFENGPYGADLSLRKVGRQDGQSYFVYDYTPVNTTVNEPYAIALDAEGNSYVAGRMMRKSIPGVGALPHFGVIKYDQEGNELWRQVQAPDDKFGRAVAIAVNSSGEVAVTGVLEEVNSYEQHSMYTMKFGADGSLLWKKAFLPVSEGEKIFGIKVHFDNDGNVYTVGCRFLAGQYYKILAVKYTSTGTFLWSDAFGSNTFFHALSSWNKGHGWEPISGIIDNQLVLIYDDMYHQNSESFSRIVFQRLNENGTSADNNEIVDFTPDNFFSSYWNIASGNIMEDGSVNLLMRGVVVNRTAGESIDGDLHMFLRLDEHGVILKEKIFKNEDGFSIMLNGAIATAENGDSYALILGKDEFVFQKVNEAMEEVWKTTIPAQYASDYFNDDHPSFVFVRDNGNPVFITTKLSGNRSNYFFMEFDGASGAEIHSEEYDRGFDRAAIGGTVPYTDKVVDARWIKGSDSFVVTGRVIDKAAEATTVATLRYGFTINNMAPELLSLLPDQTVIQGEYYAYVIPTNIFSDPEAEPLSFSVTREGDQSLPSWLSFDPETVTLSGTPPISALGLLNIQVTATDPHGLHVSDVYTLEVTPLITGSESDQPEISVYPNPGAGSLFVDNTHDFVRIQFISADGRVMLALPLHPGLNEIKPDGLAQGFYRLRLTARSGNSVGKNWVKSQ
jgi:hypothetical protein